MFLLCLCLSLAAQATDPTASAPAPDPAPDPAASHAPPDEKDAARAAASSAPLDGAPVQAAAGGAPEAVDQPAAAKGTIFFVHGLYMTSRCWQDWRDRYEQAGYRTEALDWPGREGSPASLRSNPPEVLRELSFEDVLAENREAIQALAEEPILVGHSMGGLIVQLLLEEGLGQAGVAIDSAPPRGVSSMRWSFLKSNLPVLLPGKAPIVLSVRQFHYAFANHLDLDAARTLYDAWVVPESRQVARAPLTRAARIDWEKDRPPLLIVAGGADHIIPPGLNQRNARRYKRSPGRTTFMEYEGRTHWTLAQEGWEQVADDVLGWIAELPASAAAPPHAPADADADESSAPAAESPSP